MRGLMAVVMLGMLTATAYGQNQMNLSPLFEQQKTPENAERDREYKATISKIPARKAADPWQGVRSDSTSSKAGQKQQ